MGVAAALFGACASGLPDEGGAATAGAPLRPALALASFAPPAQPFNAVYLQKLSRLVTVTDDDDPMKPDLHLRRARSHAAHAREARAAGDQAATERALGDALAEHQAALAFRSYPRADENLYELVTLLCWARREPQARAALERLATEHPSSKLLPDAYLHFAELLYDVRQFDESAKLYAKVVQAPRGKLSLFAQYRQAWSDAGGGHRARAEQALHECSRALTPAGEDPTIDSRVRSECSKDAERLRRP